MAIILARPVTCLAVHAIWRGRRGRDEPVRPTGPVTKDRASGTTIGIGIGTANLGLGIVAIDRVTSG